MAVFSRDKGHLSIGKSLDSAHIEQTIAALSVRIKDRFPDSGLSKLCDELLVVSKRSSELSEWIAKPIISIRLFVGLLIVSFAVGLGYIVLRLPLSLTFNNMGLIETITTIEAGTNELLLVAAGIFFLTSLEKRTKRKRALAAIHELRSFAHIVDMHQLTKNPERYQKSYVLTKHSPKTDMTLFELERYLDYCSEMLSLIGKISATYMQEFADEVLLAAVSEIEDLTTDLSVKIWQKIVILKSKKTAEITRPA